MTDSDDLAENRELDEDDATMVNKLINEEYKIWKKNSPMLYDLCLSRALEWPTLTVQWLPDKQSAPDKDFSRHRIILGTHTSEHKQNHLQIAEVRLPNLSSPKAEEYDVERGEIGGFNGASTGIEFSIIQKINHPSEVNKARYMWQNPDLIATMCTDGNVLLFDRTKHRSQPDSSGKVEAQIELIGHTREGYGMNWSPHEEGKLVTGSEDTSVCIWDVVGVKANSKTVNPTRTFTHHSAIVNDVQFHPAHRQWVGTASDDMTFKLLDLRSSSTNRALMEGKGHLDAVNSLAFHPHIDHIVATGSADKSVGIWDLRMLKQREAILESHKEVVQSVEWSPFDNFILASGSYDRRVNFWDVTRIGEEQTPEDAEDGPPELLFVHGGHTSHVADFSWNPHERWTICSAAEDNLLQIFRPARACVDQLPPKVSHEDVSQ